MNVTIFYVIQAIFDVVILGLIIAAARGDGKTRIVKPWIQWAMLGTAIAHFLFVLGFYLFAREGIIFGLWNDLFGVLEYPITGIMMFLIYITLVLIFKQGIGGADTKVSSIMAFYLGLIPTLIMMVVHFAAAMGYVGFQYVKNKKIIASVPLMIYIGIGYVAALIFQWITVFCSI